MKDLMVSLTQGFKQFDAKFGLLAASQLDELGDRFQKFVQSGKLSDWVKEKHLKHFKFEKPADLPTARSIVIIAVPQKISIVTFNINGKSIDTIYPPGYLSRDVRVNNLETLTRALNKNESHFKRAVLPLKLLAASSGLGMYGKNQISYTEEMGSFGRLEAYFTDLEFDRYDMQEIGGLPECDKCSRCVKSCPTKCIKGDGFYIEVERCMTNFNEYDGDVPEWIKPQFHNALVGCMVCQKVCPLNKNLLKDKERLDTFSEEETDLILKKTPFEELPEDTRSRLLDLELDEYYPMLDRNLSVLIK
jgi:epoxyqueuosine reductase